MQVQLLLEEYKMRVLLFQVRCKPLVMADEGSINHFAWRVVDRSHGQCLARLTHASIGVGHMQGQFDLKDGVRANLAWIKKLKCVLLVPPDRGEPMPHCSKYLAWL